MTASIWAPAGFSPEIVPFETFEYIATPGQTSFSILPYTVIYQHQLKVFRNGEIQRTSLWAVVGTNIVFTTALTGGDFVRVDVYKEAPISDSGAVEELPPQAGEAGKILYTDGTAPYWGAPPSGGGGGSSIYFNVKDATYGAVGDGTTDDTAAINACITAAKLGGGTVYIPAGRYRLTAPLVVDYSLETDDPIASGNNNRVAFLGDGSGSTILHSNHVGVCIDYRGGTLDGAHSFFNIKGIHLYHGLRSAGSIALKLDNVSFCLWEDFSQFGFELGLSGTDVLHIDYIRGRCWSHTKGFHFRYTNFSRPNAITFQGVAVASCLEYGGLVEGGSAFQFTGGAIEGNGISAIAALDAAVIRDSCWGLKLSDSCVEGSLGLNLSGTYIEGNAGKADIWITQTNNVANFNISGTSFLRYIADKYTLNNVRLETSGAGVGSKVTLSGNGFKSQSPYTALNTRPYVTGPVGSIYDNGNTFVVSTETDRSVFSPVSVPLIPSANFPSVEQGKLLFEPAQNGLLVASASKWRWVEDKNPTIISTDAAATLSVYTTFPTVLHTGTLTAARTLTLSTVNAYVGARFKVTRLGAGAFNLSVGGLVNLIQNQWAEVVYDGTNWILIGAGSLNPGGGSAGTVSHVYVQRTSLLDIGTSQTQIPFDSVIYDSLGEYIPSTGIFQATSAGYYHVNACAGTNAFAWQVGKQFNIRIKKNGTDYAVGSRDIKSSTTTMSASSIVNATVYLAVNEYISITAVTDRTPDADLNYLAASGVTNYLSVDRLL